ncbi:hypothetical protein ACIPWL_16845 [Streptomyces sp. NPDC090023]|uniref:hypothetical protein n=1 Tax=unclassified Streptomyces TaxID=2593676 RepID=UPI003825FDF5
MGPVAEVRLAGHPGAVPGVVLALGVADAGEEAVRLEELLDLKAHNTAGMEATLASLAEVAAARAR